MPKKQHIKPAFRLFRRIFEFMPLVLPLIFSAVVYGSPTENPSGEMDQQQKISHRSGESEGKNSDMNFDVFNMPLEQLMNVKVAVASLFTEEERLAGSSVSVISSEKWKRLGARRIHEVLNNETGVMASPYYGSYAITIRGFMTDYAFKGISALIDGIPLNDLSTGAIIFNLPNWEIGTLDRVELIKGPGSAIYGSDAFHGVFSMESFESDKDTCMVESAGGYPLYGDTNIKISKGIHENRIRINATASISGQDDLDMSYDFDDNGVTGTGKRKYAYDSKAGIFKIHSDLNEKLRIKAGAYTTSWSSDDFPGLGSKNPGVRDKDLISRDTRFHMGTGNISYMLDNGISIETGGYHWESTYRTELFISQTMTMNDYSENNRSGAKLILRQAENPLNIQWFLGYSYDRQKIASQTRKLKTASGQLVSDFGEEPRSGWSREVSSLFGQLKWGMTDDRLYFLLGARVDDYIHYRAQFTPRCGLIYLPTENSSLKALYGRAFMAPDAHHIFGSQGFLEGNPDLKPEIIDTYELIYMYRTRDLRFTLNTFYSIWQDSIITVYNSTEDPIYTQVNELKSTSLGGEMNLFYRMSPFAVELGVSYVHSKAIDSVNRTTLEKKDREYAAFPEYAINLGLYYNLKPMDIDFHINNRLFFNMEASPDIDDPDPDSLDEYYRMDCNISKNIDEKWEAILDIRNVLNRENHIPGIESNVNGYEEPGTSIVLRVTYTFI